MSWNVTGIEDDFGIEDQFPLLSLQANPSSTPILLVNLCVAGKVEASIYSIHGRLEREICNGELSTGMNEFTISDLAPGIYFCKLSCDGSTVSQRFVVLK